MAAENKFKIEWSPEGYAGEKIQKLIAKMREKGWNLDDLIGKQHIVEKIKRNKRKKRSLCS